MYHYNDYKLKRIPTYQWIVDMGTIKLDNLFSAQTYIGLVGFSNKLIEISAHPNHVRILKM